jgi:hypothetical protein
MPNYRTGSVAATESRIQILDRIPYCIQTGRRHDGFLGEDPEPVCSVCTGTLNQQRLGRCDLIQLLPGSTQLLLDRRERTAIGTEKRCFANTPKQLHRAAQVIPPEDKVLCTLLRTRLEDHR